MCAVGHVVMCSRPCGGGPCDFSVSPSPFGLDFGALDFGLVLDNRPVRTLREKDEDSLTEPKIFYFDIQ